MKNAKKAIYIAIFSLIFIILGTIKSNAGSLYLNDLKFEAQINADGSMDVTETWDIDIRSTNTLYKTFKTDSSKYSGIENVTVKELTSTGAEQSFLKTNEWAYHVTKGYYYGTENEDGDFEIGWGVGLDTSSATRKYEISYTVKDAITKYNDYAELCWQFIGKDFEISANTISGVIYLPSSVQNKEDIKVWGHTEGLNGTIYATDTNKIEFNLNNFRSGRYVEIRTLFPTNFISVTGRIKNVDILESAVKEETKWANKANAKRDRKKWWQANGEKIFLIIYLGINLLFVIIWGKKFIKHIKKNKELKKFKPTMDLEYFRDLPDERATPGEAFRLLNMKFSSYTSQNFGKVFSAVLLDLALKGYIEITQEKNEKGKDSIKIKILKENNGNLKLDEENILQFIKLAGNKKNIFTLKELEKYIKGHPTATENLLKKNFERTEQQLISEGVIDEEIKKEFENYRLYQILYTISAVAIVFTGLIIFIVPIILFVLNAIMCGKIAKKLNVLTQKGVDQQSEWKGLKKYMEDFSLLKEREVPELVVWERFLVYATVFGIAEKVIKQLKIVYPNFEELSNGITTYSYMNLMMTTNFSNSFSHAISSSINSSISSTYSSGSGSGGGFSGGGGFGGGGGRRRWKIN